MSSDAEGAERRRAGARMPRQIKPRGGRCLPLVSPLSPPASAPGVLLPLPANSRILPIPRITKPAIGRAQRRLRLWTEETLRRRDARQVRASTDRAAAIGLDQFAPCRPALEEIAELQGVRPARGEHRLARLPGRPGDDVSCRSAARLACVGVNRYRRPWCRKSEKSGILSPPPARRQHLRLEAGPLVPPHHQIARPHHQHILSLRRGAYSPRPAAKYRGSTTPSRKQQKTSRRHKLEQAVVERRSYGTDNGFPCPSPRRTRTP